MAKGWVERYPARGWRARVQLDNGRTRSKIYALKRDAQQWVNDQMRDLKRGEFVDPRRGRLRYAKWLEEFRASEISLRSSTLAQNDSIYRNHVSPYFGAMPLGEIDQTEVQRFVRALVKKGLAPSTVQKCYIVLSKSLGAAQQAGAIAVSPCHDVNLPRIVHEEMRFLEPAEVARLAGAIQGRYTTLIMLAAYSGLRMGELAGLRRKRIDLDAGIVHVEKIITEVGGELVEGPPKTRAGRRRVPIPTPVVALLAEHLERYCSSGPEALVFTGAQGGVFRLRSWRSRHFAPAAERASVAPLRPHDLRHTAVAIWIAAGVGPKDIAVRAGHTSVSVVLDRYGHLFTSSEDTFAAKVGELYVGLTEFSSTH